MGAEGTSSVRTVLVVDDDHAQADATARLLKIAGLHAVTASDISSAVTLLGSKEITVAMVDTHLGREHGPDLIKMIRRDFPEMPTVLLSGSAPDELEAEAAKCGARAYLPKPFDLSTLLEILGVRDD
jgi:DNA-binding NtrC family response regulator